MSLAEQYITAFKQLAKVNNTLILPSNVGDISSFVAQALSVYKSVSGQNIGSLSTTARTPNSPASTQSMERNEQFSFPPMDFNQHVSEPESTPEMIISRKVSSAGSGGGALRGSSKNIE